MFGRPRPARILTAALTLTTWAFAAFIAVDTLRAVVPLWSPLPWLDEWATVSLLDAWQAGDMTAAQALFSQHNEHRILVPRLLFAADDLLVRGGGTLLLACIFAVQALHAGVFTAVLARARPHVAGRWAVAAVILAMMFSLRQEENLSSGFQLQFVAVFAGATLTFALFALALGQARAGGGPGWALPASLGAALLTAFTMANGLAAAWVVAALAAMARMRARLILLFASWAALITIVYMWGYEKALGAETAPTVGLALPLKLLFYAAAYLGNVLTEGDVGLAAALGLLGMILTAVAAARSIRRADARTAALAMVGVMLFVGVTAAITASGRVGFGFAQALSSRYATGSIAFWSAQLVYWWLAPTETARRIGAVALPPGALGRGAVAALAAVLCLAVAVQQGGGRTKMVAQSFLQNESANLLMLGLDDPAVVRRAAWTDEDVQRLLPVLKEDGLSIFGTADYAGLGRPATERGPLGPPCAGDVERAAADPALGRDGVRVAGRALDAKRLVRRVLLAGADGRVVGLASGAIPGAARDAWRGFAVAAPGTVLTAYGFVDGRLCRIGEAPVTSGDGSRAAAP